MTSPLNKPVPDRAVPGLLRSSSIVGLMTFMSRVLGLVRDMVFARYIGAGNGADAFFVAFKIPNFFRRLFAEGAFAQAFVPVLSEYRTNGSHAAVKALIDRVAGCLGSVLIFVTVVAVCAAPAVAALFAPGFVNDPVKFALTSDLIRITFPYLMLISLTGFAGAILNSYDRFAIPAVTPVLLNICLIVAVVIVAPWFERPVYGLAWGVFAAGVIQLVFQLPFLARMHLFPAPKWGWSDPGVKRILALMAPAIFGVSVSQLNLLLDTVLASFLPTGSVSWLYYSDRLSELPLGVFGIAIATVILPSLSRLHASADAATFSSTLNWALRLVTLIALPATVALFVLAKPILSTLFLYGETTANDIAMSALSLRAYALGLLAFMLIKVLAPGYFSRQDTRTPVKIGVVAMVANMVLNIIFVVPLYFYWHVGHLGLALATSVAAFLNAYLLYRGLRKVGVFQPDAEWLPMFARIVFANALMGLCLWACLQQWSSWEVWSGLARTIYLSVICALGLLVYIGSLFSTGLRPRHLRH